MKHDFISKLFPKPYDLLQYIGYFYIYLYFDNTAQAHVMMSIDEPFKLYYYSGIVSQVKMIMRLCDSF